MANGYGSSTFARPPGIPQPNFVYHSPDGNSKWKGPRRVCIFCSLAIVLPSLLISIPLLMRFVIYGSSSYLLHPSDMMLLDQRISTTWCQEESIKVNTTFTAYVTPGEPSMFETPTTLAIDQQMKIPDDQKEYWGLYLLPGSVFRIRTCAKHRGGTLLIVRGYKHMEYCAYVGEADSAGNSDQVSGSMSVEAIGRLHGSFGNPPHVKEEEKGQGQDELNIFSRLKTFLQSHPSSRNKIQKTLEEWMLLNSTEKGSVAGGENFNASSETAHATSTTTSTPKTTTTSTSTPSPSSSSSSSSSASPVEEEVTTAEPEHLVEHGKILRKRRSIDIRKDTESGENGAFEEDSPPSSDNQTDPLILPHNTKNLSISDLKPFQTPNSIWKLQHNQHSGVFSDYIEIDDGSKSESESSFSSSEEALLKCEGIIASFKIPHDHEGCRDEGPYEDLILSKANPEELGSSASMFEFQVQQRDYYYFIFGSENEKATNFIRSKFELQKVEYRLPEPVPNCTNVKECQIPFGFASSEKVVIRLPQPLHNATSNLIYVAETECKPRAHLYLIFVILVPVVILMFAFK